MIKRYFIFVFLLFFLQLSFGQGISLERFQAVVARQSFGITANSTGIAKVSFSDNGKFVTAFMLDLPSTQLSKVMGSPAKLKNTNGQIWAKVGAVSSVGECRMSFTLKQDELTKRFSLEINQHWVYANGTSTDAIVVLPQLK